MTAAAKPMVIATDRAALKTALAMLARDEASGVIYIDDRAGGGVQVRCFVSPGDDAEARLAELYAMVARAADADGAVLVDAARLVRRGAA